MKKLFRDLVKGDIIFLIESINGKDGEPHAVKIAACRDSGMYRVPLPDQPFGVQSPIAFTAEFYWMDGPHRGEFGYLSQHPDLPVRLGKAKV